MVVVRASIDRFRGYINPNADLSRPRVCAAALAHPLCTGVPAPARLLTLGQEGVGYTTVVGLPVSVTVLQV